MTWRPVKAPPSAVSPQYAAGSGGVGGSSPVNTVLPVVTGTITEGLTVGASTGTWTGTPDSYEYDWQVNGTATVTGSSTAPYSLPVDSAGKALRVLVTAIKAAVRVQALSIAYVIAAATDAFFSSVSLLLHADGTNGATSTTDTSPRPKTATFVGNAQISTAQSKFGGSSLLLDGVGDYLTFADHADFAFGSGDFTVEAFVRLSALATSNGGLFKATVVAKDSAGTAARAFAFNIAGSAAAFNTLEFSGWATSTQAVTTVSGSFSFALNTWYHVAAVRSGNLVYLFVNGALLNTGGTAFSTNIQTNTTTLRVGASAFDATFSFYLHGNMDEIRITKGVARYTSAFTVQTTEFPDQ